MKGLDKILRVGLLWSLIQVILKRFFDFIIKLILLNILFPEDFGILSMAVTFTSILQVIAEFGFKNALVQRKEKNLDEAHFQSVFWFGLVWSTLLFILVYFFLTPLVSNFFEESILIKIIPILSIFIIIESLTLVFRVKILRRLNFKKMALIQTVSMIFAGIIALVLALNDGGIWALVLYVLVPYVIQLPLFLYYVSWRPKFIFSVVHLKEIFNFSFFTFITTFLVVLSVNVDYLFVGKIMGAKPLGIYTLAYMFTLLLSSQLTSMVDRVLFPFYSKVQNEVTLIKKYYLTSLEYYAIVVYPIMLALLVLTAPIFKLFFNENWYDSIPIIRILAIVVVVKLITHGSTLVYRSLGRPKLETYIYLITLLLIMLPAIYLGSFYGVIGISIGILIATVLNLVITLYFLDKELAITFKDILIQLKAPIIAVVLSAIVVVPLYLYLKTPLFLCLLVLFFVYGYVIYYYHSDIFKNYSKILFKK